TILFLPIGLLFATGYDPRSMSAGAWAGLLYLAFLTSALNYVVWYWGLEYLKPGTGALMTNVQPVVAAAMAWLFPHERLAAGGAGGVGGGGGGAGAGGGGGGAGAAARGVRAGSRGRGTARPRGGSGAPAGGRHRHFCGTKLRAAELMQYRRPVGAGPSSKTWP